MNNSFRMNLLCWLSRSLKSSCELEGHSMKLPMPSCQLTEDFLLIMMSTFRGSLFRMLKYSRFSVDASEPVEPRPKSPQANS